MRWRDIAPAGLDSAVEALERARRREPENIVFLNDLAVAYLELGERDQQLMPMLRALDVVERATTRDSTLPSVLYNRALILERLYLVSSAQRAWGRYLAVERDPGWRAEAESHVRRLAQVADTVSWDTFRRSPLRRIDNLIRAEIVARVKHSPQAARDFSFWLLGQWGTAVLKGDCTGAARRLRLAREIGAAADTLGLDRSISLAVQAIDAAGSNRRLRRLARGHKELQRGLTLFFQPDFKGAAASLRAASHRLRTLNSPVSHWATLYYAASQVQLGMYSTADRHFRNVLARATAAEPALVGKAIWGLGVSHLRRGHYETASQFYHGAAPSIIRAKELENEGALLYLLSESLNLAGQSAVGRAEALRGLAILSHFPRSNYLNNHLTTVASYARANGLSYAALAVMGEVLEVARSVGKADVIAWALRAYAKDLTALGRHTAAWAEMASALRWARRMKAGHARDRVEADIALATGQISRRENPRAALPLLYNAVEIYRRLNSDLDLPSALYEAAQAAHATGDWSGAHRHLQHAVEQIERQEASFEKAEVRASFYETVENVFDAMITTELDGMQSRSAFQYLERGRVAIGNPGKRRTRATDVQRSRTRISDLQAQLTEGMLFVEYALLRDRIAIWAVSPHGWRQYSVPVSRDSVAALVNRFTREIRAPNRTNLAGVAEHGYSTGSRRAVGDHPAASPT